jgi:putative membrane protein
MPGFWDWSLSPPVVLVIGFGYLYWLSNRTTVGPARTVGLRRRRHAYFYAGLAALLLALASPLDALSEQLFWAHMLQHILLLVVAPPLIVLACPWVRLWRVLPLEARKPLGRSLARGRLVWLRRLSAGLGRPLPSFVLFCGVMLAWHVPVMFDATLHSQALHALEHALFFASAVMFWKHVIDSPPLHAPLRELQRVVYVIGAMVVMWALAVVLALAPYPLYGAYANEATRPEGISALGDQQVAAGIMWVPGSIAFVIVLFLYLNRWLAPGPAAAAPTPVRAQPMTTPSRSLVSNH